MASYTRILTARSAALAVLLHVSLLCYTDLPAALASDPATLYKQKCSACHTIGGGNRVGPDLAPTAKWSIGDLTKAVKGMEKNVGPLTTEETDSLVTYLKNSKVTKQAPAAATTATSPTIPAEPQPKQITEPPPATSGQNGKPTESPIILIGLVIAGVVLGILAVGYGKRKKGAPTDQPDEQPIAPEEARRHFIHAFVGIGIGGVLLSIGTVRDIFSFFFGPRLTRKEETELMELRLRRLESTVAQRKLELERQEANYILVAQFSELSEDTGKYFIDYKMLPAIAFKGKDGLPLLISAKCTHLGCTVGNQVDAQGKILCPCHISYFDIQTGQPNAGSPAKTPLPHLGWVVMDEHGKVLASRNAQGQTTGSIATEAQSSARVYIAKSQEETA